MIPTTNDTNIESITHTEQATISKSGDDDHDVDGTGTGATKDEDDNEDTGTDTGSRTIRRTKFFIIIFLMIMTSIHVVAYNIIWNAEDEEFKNQYWEDSVKVLETMGSNFVRTLEASDAFVVSMTSFVIATNQTWPWVVIPDFAVRAEKLRSLANAVHVNTHHLVKPNQRKEWEHFTAEKGGPMIRDSIEAMEDYPGRVWPIVWNYTLLDVIHTSDEMEKEKPGEIGIETPGPWLPMWQTQPTIAHEPPYNLDLISAQPLGSSMSLHAHERLLRSHKVTVTESYLISHPGDEERPEYDKNAERIASYLLDGNEPVEPISDIFYPIIAGENELIEYDDSYSHHDIAGILSLSVYWRYTIEHILPKNHDGIHVVFENPCNPTFTYQINGPDVIFLGAGDFHDETYDDLKISRTLFEVTRKAMQGSSYSGLPVDEDFCPLRITVYPSAQTELKHRSNTPKSFPW